jgi:hypothetical protein
MFRFFFCLSMPGLENRRFGRLWSAMNAPLLTLILVSGTIVARAQVVTADAIGTVMPPSSQSTASSSVIWTETESWTRLRIGGSPPK